MIPHRSESDGCAGLRDTECTLAIGYRCEASLSQAVLVGRCKQLSSDSAMSLPDRCAAAVNLPHPDSKLGCICQYVQSNGRFQLSSSAREFYATGRLRSALVCRRQAEFSKGTSRVHEGLKDDSLRRCIRWKGVRFRSPDRHCIIGFLLHESLRSAVSKREPWCLRCARARSLSGSDIHG